MGQHPDMANGRAPFLERASASLRCLGRGHRGSFRPLSSPIWDIRLAACTAGYGLCRGEGFSGPSGRLQTSMSLIQLGTWAQLWILGLTAHSGGGLTLRTAEGVFRAQILPNAAWRIVGQRSGVSWEDQRSQFHVGQTPYGPGYSV